jgi:hypothetical protein
MKRTLSWLVNLLILTGQGPIFGCHVNDMYRVCLNYHKLVAELHHTPSVT